MGFPDEIISKLWSTIKMSQDLLWGDVSPWRFIVLQDS